MRVEAVHSLWPRIPSSIGTRPGVFGCSIGRRSAIFLFPAGLELERSLEAVENWCSTVLFLNALEVSSELGVHSRLSLRGKLLLCVCVIMLVQCT